MGNLLEVKNQIASYNDTAKITKAMQLVSAVKLRKLEGQFANNQAYLSGLKQILMDLVKSERNLESTLLRVNQTGKVAFIVIGSARGFVGPQLNRVSELVYDKITELKLMPADYEIISVKAKTLKALNRLGLEAKAHFQEALEQVDEAQLTPIKQLIIDGYEKQQYKTVYIAYTYFKSISKQEPLLEKFLPLAINEIVAGESVSGTFKYEPGQAQILGKLLKEYSEIVLKNVIASATASEYAARMLVMQQATDNCETISSTLTNVYNKERQTAITASIQETVNARMNAHT